MPDVHWVPVTEAGGAQVDAADGGGGKGGAQQRLGEEHGLEGRGGGRAGQERGSAERHACLPLPPAQPLPRPTHN